MPMNFLLLGMVLILTLGFSLAILFILRRQDRERNSSGDHAARLMLEFQREITSLRSSLSDQVLALSRQMNDQLTHNTSFLQKTQQSYNDAVGQVQHRLGELQQATKSMMDIGKDISSLHQILQSPKLRGGLGELLLAELLKQILPEDHFALQYTFQNGCKVDAVILLGQGIIPVDAKFPLENFKRLIQATSDENSKSSKKEFIQNVKKHIDDIASKYILPAEGTFDFALMYIPAENVYYETIIKDDNQTESLAAYALRQRVVPVSPNSFYAYLQAIVRGLKGLRIERSAQLILESLGQLETDFKKCLDDFEKIGSHISNASSAYDKVSRRFDKLRDKLSSIENKRPEALPGDPSFASKTDERVP
ncbi:MAG: DNA recombination protein RmuC [Candidatus Omnitrophica bacterium]|nr:DNA recombination protein RmuC [Candidatus Omnitrophota bacterium]